MAARTMGRGKITQLDLRRIKAEYFRGLDPAQIGLFLFNERKPQRWTLLIEKVLRLSFAGEVQSDRRDRWITAAM